MSDNIKVAIRLRPLISKEKRENLNVQWAVKDNSVYPVDPITGKKDGDTYHFDHIFDNRHNNLDIYSTVVAPVVNAAISGFNGTIFAYGQTSSGKTYTMMGTDREPGVISLAVDSIFSAIELSFNRKFLIRVSYMEIYNEKIYDLLNVGSAVKIHEDYNGSVIVKVKEVVSDTAIKVHQIMKKGNKARRIGETNMNEKSSRSHTIFRIIIESSDEKDSKNVVNVAQLNLVDLAGSERAAQTKATGMRFKEGAHINKSLSALSLVMKQLSESQDFINFRDSKLTRILQSSLGGNALTAVICAVTPAALEETHSTLMFASRAKSVKNKPQVNEIITEEALINRYATQIDRLKKELEKATAFNKGLQVDQYEKDAINERLKERIALLEKSVLRSADFEVDRIATPIRRMTWCAPVSHRYQPVSELPIIFEHDILHCSKQYERESSETDHNKSILDIDQLDEREIPFDDCELALIENEKFCRDYQKKDGSYLSLLSVDDDVFELESSFSPSTDATLTNTDSPEIVQDISSTQYREKSISSRELEDFRSLKIAYKNLNVALENERNLKLQIEASHKQELNDYAYLVDMYKDRYTRRENELLKLLVEARQETNDRNNTRNSSLANFPDGMELMLKNMKEQLDILICDINAGKPYKQNLKSLTANICAYIEISVFNESGEIENFFENVLFLLEQLTALLTVENTLSDLEFDKRNLSNIITNLESQQNEKLNYIAELSEKNMKLEKENGILQKEFLSILQKVEHYEIYIKEISADSTEKQHEIDEHSKKNLHCLDQLPYCKENLIQMKSLAENNKYKETGIQTDEQVSDMEVNTRTLNQLKENIKTMSCQMQTILDRLNHFSESILTYNRSLDYPDEEFMNTNLIQPQNCNSDEISQQLRNQIIKCESMIRNCERNLKQSNKYVLKKDQIIQTDGEKNVCQKIEELFNQSIYCISEVNSKDVNYNAEWEQTVRSSDIDEEVHTTATSEITEIKKESLTKLKNMSDYNKREQSIIVSEADHSVQTDLNDTSNLIHEKDKITSQYQEQLLNIERNVDVLIQQKDKEIRDLSDKIMKYQDKCISIEKELQECKNECKSTLIMNQIIQTDISDIGIDVHLNKNDVSTTTDELEHLSNTCIISSIKSKFEFMMADLDDNVEDKIFILNEKMENFTHKLMIQISKIETLNKKLIDTIKTKQALIDELLKNKLSLENEKVTLSSKITNLERETQNKINVEIRKNKEFNLQMCTLEENYRKQLEEMSNEVANANMKLKTKEIAIDNLQHAKDESVQRLEHKLKDSEIESTKYLNQIKSLKASLHSTRNENFVLKQQYEEACLKKDCALCYQMKELYNSEVEKHKLTQEKYKDNLNKYEFEKNVRQEMSADLQKKYTVSIQKLQDREKELRNKLEIKELDIDKLQIELQNTKESKLAVKCSEQLLLIRELEQNIISVKEELNHLNNKYEDAIKANRHTMQKANMKIMSYRNIINKLKNDNELLKNKHCLKENDSEEICLLRTEFENYQTEASNEKTLLENKIVDLERDVERVNKMNTYYNKLTAWQTDEIKHLKEKLLVAEEHLQDAVKQLTEEKNNSFKNAQKLEETLEDVKYELHELKYKEKIKDTKVKRQHLFDSTRNIPVNTTETVPDTLCSQNCKCEILAAELAICKSKLKSIEGHEIRVVSQSDVLPKKDHLDMSGPISGIVTSYNYTRLQDELKTMNEKYEKVKELCKIRKMKIMELENQLKKS